MDEGDVEEGEVDDGDVEEGDVEEGDVVEDGDIDEVPEVDELDEPDDCRFLSSSSAFLMHSCWASWPVRFLHTCLASSSDFGSWPLATPPDVAGSGEVVGSLRRVGCVAGVDGEPVVPPVVSEGAVPGVGVGAWEGVVCCEGVGVVEGDVVDVCAMAAGKPAPIAIRPAAHRVCRLMNISRPP